MRFEVASLEIGLPCKPDAFDAVWCTEVLEHLFDVQAAGQVKATTGGGISYGLLAARLAAETIGTAFASGCFTAAAMSHYERRWQALLAEELALGLAFRKLYGWLNDRQVDGLLYYIARHGLKDLIRQKAHFDWHRELITAMGRSLPLGQLCRSLLFGL